MNDIIVSVRMPESMLRQLKHLAAENHFLDVSDEIRAVVREKTMKYNRPYDASIKHIVDKLEGEIAKRAVLDKKKAVADSLRRLLEELEND